MAPIVTHSTELYELGGGIVFFAPWVGTTAPSESAFYDVGNVLNFEVNVKVEKLEHKSSRGGRYVVDKIVLTETGYDLSFTLDEISIKNLAIFYQGEIEGSKIHAGQAPMQEFAVRFVGDSYLGESKTYDFWRVNVSGDGGTNLISMENWKELSFAGEGLEDSANHSTTPLFDVTVNTTTPVPPPRENQGGE